MKLLNAEKPKWPKEYEILYCETEECLKKLTEQIVNRSTQLWLETGLIMILYLRKLIICLNFWKFYS